MLPDLCIEHLAHGALPLGSRKAGAPMTPDPRVLLELPWAPRAQSISLIYPSKKSDFENEPCGVVFNAGVISSDRLPEKSCGSEGKL